MHFYAMNAYTQKTTLIWTLLMMQQGPVRQRNVSAFQRTATASRLAAWIARIAVW